MGLGILGFRVRDSGVWGLGILGFGVKGFWVLRFRV